MPDSNVLRQGKAHGKDGKACFSLKSTGLTTCIHFDGRGVAKSTWITGYVKARKKAHGVGLLGGALETRWLSEVRLLHALRHLATRVGMW